jgi:hypothetical protein
MEHFSLSLLLSLLFCPWVFLARYLHQVAFSLSSQSLNNLTLTVALVIIDMSLVTTVLGSTVPCPGATWHAYPDETQEPWSQYHQHLTYLLFPQQTLLVSTGKLFPTPLWFPNSVLFRNTFDCKYEKAQ